MSVRRNRLAEYVSEVEDEIGRKHDDEKTRQEKKVDGDRKDVVFEKSSR